MVTCPSCGHENAEGSKFCEKCGAALQGQSIQSTQNTAAASADNAKANEYLEATKQVSLSFFHYFSDVIKHPFSSGKRYGASNLTNSIITMVLFAVFLGLTVYFGIKNLIKELGTLSYIGEIIRSEEMNIQVSFVEFGIKPFLFFAIFVFIIAALVFAASKLSKMDADFKSILVRYGSYLVPFLGLVAIGFLLSLLNIDIFTWFSAIGFIGTFFIVPVLVLVSLYRENKNGLDIAYSSLFVVVCTMIVLYIAQRMYIAGLVEKLEEIMGQGLFF
ncbi:zinc-ribbon domain-containing protein [Terribacillus halophilus]|uniref:Zinc-ribbon domain-containing protein n=2 Tax=Terribacillus halophilus TaxID=361279 RepID=A0A1G6TAU4_9BACI|nr:zinc-ribbon domain-containing protein [Terribacillus halophilus]